MVPILSSASPRPQGLDDDEHPPRRSRPPGRDAADRGGPGGVRRPVRRPRRDAARPADVRAAGGALLRRLRRRRPGGDGRLAAHDRPALGTTTPPRSSGCTSRRAAAGGLAGGCSPTSRRPPRARAEVLVLETGTRQPEAIALYESCGCVAAGEDQGAGPLVAGSRRRPGPRPTATSASWSPASRAAARSTIAAAIGFARTTNLARSRRLRRSGRAASTPASAHTAVYHGRQAASCHGLNDSGSAATCVERQPDLTAVQRHHPVEGRAVDGVPPAHGLHHPVHLGGDSSHSRRAVVVAPDAVHHRRRGRGEGDAAERGAAGLLPAPTEALRERDRLVEVAGDRRRGEQPLDGEVVRLAEERQLAALLRVATGGVEVAGGQVHHRRHVQGVRVLPRHLDVVAPGARAARGGAGRWRRPRPSSPQIRCTAVSWSSAWLSRRVSPTRWASSTARSARSPYAGSNSSAAVVTVSTAASTWTSPAARARASPSRACSSPGGASSDMMPGAFVIDLGRARQLEGGATRVAGPAGRLGRGAEEPDRLVAGVPAPGHGRAEVEGVGGFGGVGRQRGRLLVALLGLARLAPGVGELGPAARRARWASARSAGWPAAQPQRRRAGRRPPRRTRRSTPRRPSSRAAVARHQRSGGPGRRPARRSVHQLGAVLPDRLEHPVAGAGGRRPPPEALVGQAGEGVGHRRGVSGAKPGDLGRRRGA